MTWIRERWIPILVIGFLVIGLGSVGYVQHEQQSPSYSAENGTQQSVKRSSPETALSHSEQAPPAQQSISKDEWERRDHQAQIGMFWAAVAAVFLTFIGLGLVGFTLYFTREAARAANRTLNEAQKATDAAVTALHNDRAWLAVHDTPHSLVDNFILTLPSGKKVTTKNAMMFSVKLKNVGQSPAREVQSSMDFKIALVGDPIPVFDTHIEKGMRSGFVAQGGTYSKGKLQIIGPETEKIWDKTHVAYIFVNIEYMTIFDDVVRHTRETFKFFPEGSHTVNGEQMPLFSISQVGDQNLNT